jgi:HEAT repeat protein
MGQLSAHALTLMQSLMAAQTSTRAEPPSQNVINDLVTLFGDDDVDRFNPPDHAALLEQVSIHVPFAHADPNASQLLGKRSETVADESVARQLGRTLLELLETVGASTAPEPILARLETLFRSDLAAGEFDEAFELAQKLTDLARSTPSNTLRQAIDESIGNLATPEMIRTLIDSLQNAPPEKTRVLQRLTETLGSSARRNLLLALSEESNRSRRRRLFDFIMALGPVIAPEATSFLNDDRWYVLRNMLIMLRAVNDRSSLPEVRKLATHRDLRVRMEAIKSLFTLDSGVPIDLLENVIQDPDPKVAETAIALVGSAGIREGVQPLLRIVKGNDVFGSRRSLRIKAIRALGELGDPASLPELRRFFRDSFFPWPSKEERLAAWESLAGYSREVRSDFVERGARSRDPQVREICERISQ